MRDAFRAWYFRAVHYVDQFKDEAPACCGTCRGCAAATAVGLTGLLVSSIRRGDLGSSERDRD